VQASLGRCGVPSRGHLTDIAGLRVGHWSDFDALTGCTVVLCERPFVASVEVRGGAPGTRETDLLAPGRLVERVDAILLTGGSAFGLAAADGVVRWLREQGRGHPTAVVPVPIVPAAVIFDLAIGAPAWPDTNAGYAAVAAATVGEERGCIGAGVGATVGKFAPGGTPMKSGVGSACLHGAGGLRVGALAIVNALGNVIDPASGHVLAGARVDGAFADFCAGYSAGPLENTTIAVVATNADLGRTDLWRLSQMAQNGLARSLRPVHTQYDGDAVFSLATGAVQANLSLVGALAADALALAVADAALAARSLGGLLARRDLPATPIA
jgi:L-aminopeptidase/D-esterase-like protein